MSTTSRLARLLAVGGLAGVAGVAATLASLPAAATDTSSTPAGVPAGVPTSAATTPPAVAAPGEGTDLPPRVVLPGPVLSLAPWVLPLRSYRLTGRFGTADPLWADRHTGLDLAAPAGTAIHAVAGGTVTTVELDGAYGRRTVVTLPDGTETWYCHQTSQLVGFGDRVAAGEVVGTVGSTGNTTGAHLHLEVRPGGGDPVDPEEALAEHGVRP